MVRFDVEFRHIGWNNVHFQNDEQQNVDTKYCQHVKMSTYLYKCRISLGCTNFFYNTDKFGQVLWLGQRSNPVLYSTILYIRHFVYCLIIWHVGKWCVNNLTFDILLLQVGIIRVGIISYDIPIGIRRKNVTPFCARMSWVHRSLQKLIGRKIESFQIVLQCF
jgi:hypothetical protein